MYLNNSEELLPENSFNKLVIGPDNDPVAEIEPYEYQSSHRLEQISTHKNSLSSIAPWFEFASFLVPKFSGASVLANTYVLTAKPELIHGLQNGSFNLMEAAGGGLRGVVVDNNNVIRGQVVLHSNKQPAVSGLNSTGSAWQLLNLALNTYHLYAISSQLEALNKNVQSIKNTLDTEVLGSVLGNLEYLKTIQHSLLNHNPSSQNLERYNYQIDTIERESLKNIASLMIQMDNVITKLAPTKLEKNLFVFRNEEKMAEIDLHVEGFKRASDTCRIALWVRSVVIQTRCALPDNDPAIALALLDRISDDLSTWRSKQFTFYDELKKRIPQMDGLFADNDKQEKFKSNIQEGNLFAHNQYRYVTRAISKIKKTLATLGSPTEQAFKMVIELDQQSNIIKISRLNPPVINTDAENDDNDLL